MPSLDPDLLKAYLENACERLEDGRRPLKWSVWRHAAVAVPVALGLSLSCGGGTFTTEKECTEGDCAEQCSDSVDNDADGRIDCDDADCESTCDVDPTVTEEDCSNGKDDDGDSLADCADSDCVDEPPCMAVPEYGIIMETECADTLDNDDDGLTDCDDSDCAQQAPCAVAPLYAMPMEDCGNDVDDDGDKAVDCADSDCAQSSVCAGARYAVILG